MIQGKRTALIVVDIQKGFIRDIPSQVLSRIYDHLDEKVFSFPYDIIAATKFVNKRNSNFETILNWTDMVSIEETSLDPVVEEAAELIYEKSTYGLPNELIQELKNRNIDTTVVVGFESDQCVLVSAIQLFDASFNVIVDTDACSSKSSIGESSSKHILKRAIGKDNIVYSH